MNDQQIIILYFARDEQAIVETERKYSGLCRSVAMNILASTPDTEEVLNDTWLKAWDSIPPAHPAKLSAFLAKITRNLSLNRRRMRLSRVSEVSMEELADTIAADENRAEELITHINTFLGTLSSLDRDIFVGRYFYACSVNRMAAKLGLTPNAVSLRLRKIREQLRIYLEKEGFHP
ncbi:MAG: sigma-70 family RNA polymerase sigma factor [Ruminococcaceae bacterium]|nr:sigma-70 family RNA polymerase sigma factor [Oscillospiraceae bacterium]